MSFGGVVIYGIAMAVIVGCVVFTAVHDPKDE